ncbi:hypothetical protein POM88_018315 [Heracleum sosnowskyi]|uniref:Uncharacterized protein n=1 Tax=Heracleum sosnowskyi TaxID=360622 RepID=A0AAD8MZ54_9APIA|nr:hypothetical protein POM88_018315 [Heracleum sosnowskyi]
MNWSILQSLGFPKNSQEEVLQHVLFPKNSQEEVLQHVLFSWTMLRRYLRESCKVEIVSILGVENPVLHISDFSGVTPEKIENQTPNFSGVAALTSRVGFTPSRDVA